MKITNKIKNNIICTRENEKLPGRSYGIVNFVLDHCTRIVKVDNIEKIKRRGGGGAIFSSPPHAWSSAHSLSPKLNSIVLSTVHASETHSFTTADIFRTHCKFSPRVSSIYRGLCKLLMLNFAQRFGMCIMISSEESGGNRL